MTTRSEVEDAAGAWVARMHSDQVTSEDERQFSAWLAADPAHGPAYDRHNALWSQIGALRHDPEAVDALSSLRERPSRPFVTSRRGLIAASLVGGVAVTGAWVGWEAMFGAKAYATEVGEQQRVVLDDGSTVTLNTDSALRVRFGKAARRVWLDKGQAFFAVARDAARPFRVFVGDDEVRAPAAAFDVRRIGDAAQVTLEEGALEVYRGDAAETARAETSAPALILQPGERAVVSPAAPIEVAAIDTRAAGAWRFGRMVLEAEPLSEAVAEINRYNTRQIILADPELYDLPVNGVFQTGRPEAFVEILTAAFPIRVVRQDVGAIYLERETAPS